MIIKPISDEEIRNAQIQGNLPNRPTQKSLYPDNTLTAEDVKAAIDKLPKLVAKRLNELIQTIVGSVNGNLNEDSLAAMMQTGIREGHTLKDLFLEIARGDLSFLPAISDEDNKKVLTVENGEWTLKNLQTKENTPYFFIGKSGAINDEVIYEKIKQDKLLLFYVTDEELLVLLTPSGLLDDGKVFLFQGMALSQEDQTATLYQITLFPDESWTLTEYSLSKENVSLVQRGKSAYEIALEHGFVGSEKEWLASLKANCDILEQVTSADNGKILSVENGKSTWVKPEENPLPKITSADDGKFLSAENGKWVTKTIESVGGIHAKYVTLRGGSEGTLTEDEYTLLANRENYFEYIVEESANSSKIYDCHLAENTKTQKTYVSNTFSDENGNSVYIIIHVYSNRAWYKTQKSTNCFEKPTQNDNGKILGVVNGSPTWVEQESGSGSASERQYVKIYGGNEGKLGDAELFVLSKQENGIEYIVEESANSSTIYPCYLSENTKTKKTYVSHTFNDLDGIPSYILIHVYTSGTWYKTQKSYQCFAKPTNTDNGKVLGVVNGTPTWVDASSSDEEYGGENANIPYIITGKSGKIDDDVIYEKLMAGKKDLLYVTDNSDIVIMNGASSLSNDTAYYLVGQNTDACGRHIIYQMLLDSNRNWVVTVNAVGKLSGRSDELTPQDVYTALEEGSAIAVVHTDTTYGTVWFNCFSYSQLAGVVSSVVFETGISRMCAQLIGDISQNTWTFTAFDLSSSSGVPNEGAINSLIDRKIADVTTLIQEQLGVIENGTY